MFIGWVSKRFMCYVLCTRPTIWIPDQYIRKQDSIHLSGIQMVRLSIFKWYLNTRQFGIQPLLDHLITQLVWYSDPHCILMASKHSKNYLEQQDDN